MDDTDIVKENPAPEGETPEAEEEGKASKEAPEGKAPGKRPWWEHRIAEETAKRHEEKAQREALERKLQVAEEALRTAAKGGNGTGDPAAGARVDVDAIRKEIRAEESLRAANELAAAQFTETCNRIAIQGKKDFRNFDANVQKLQGAQALTPEMVLMAAEMDNPAAIIYALGSDLDEAMRIKALPPAKQAGAMAKLALSLEGKAELKTPKTSSAPEPITPIRGSPKGEIDLFDDKANIADWIAERDRQLAEKTKRRG